MFSLAKVEKVDKAITVKKINMTTQQKCRFDRLWCLKRTLWLLNVITYLTTKKN